MAKKKQLKRRTKSFPIFTPLFIILTVITFVLAYSIFIDSGVRREPPPLPPAPVVVEPPKKDFTSKPLPTAQEIFDEVNKARVANGVPPLISDSRLNASAQRKADEIAKEGWDDTPHVNNQGQHGYTYINDAAPGLCSVGSENLASDGLYLAAEHVVDGWMNSPGHRKALLNPSYTLTGVGVSGVYIVQHFCAPR